MCGLFGWVGDDPRKFNKDKFDKLGIYNVSRGRHSCGVAVDGELYKGISRNSDYKDFIANTGYPTANDVPVVIGHTRHATVGAHTEKNAHPFKFDYGEEGYFIGAHNGTLKNHIELAHKYDIKDPSSKIDSQILLEIISQDDANLRVLEQYRGAAALLMYTSAEKDTLWLFRGKSGDSFHTRNVKRSERPLFYYQEDEGSMYISSLRNSLESIVNEPEERDTKIFEVLENRLYKIVAGKVEKKYIINRGDVWNSDNDFPLPSRNRNTNTNSHRRAPVNHSATSNHLVRTDNTNDVIPLFQGMSEDNSLIDTNKVSNIHYEKVIHNNLDQIVNYENFRYKRTGHLLTSVCIFSREIGFIPLDVSIAKSKAMLSNFKYEDGSIGKTLEYGDISEQVKLFFIYRGVLMKEQLDYSISVEKDLKNVQDLSFMSEYPIVNYTETINARKGKKVIKNNNQGIILEDKEVDHIEFEPLGSYNRYRVVKGNLISIDPLDDFKCPEDKDSISIYDIMESEFEADNTFENEVLDNITYIDDEMLDSIIDISTQYEHLIQGHVSLLDYRKESELVKKFIHLGHDISEKFEPLKKEVEILIDVSTEK